MKRFTIIGSALAVVLAFGLSWSGVASLFHKSSATKILTTTTGSTAGSTRTDTIWFSQNLQDFEGKPIAPGQKLRDYSGYRLRVVVGNQAASDTTNADYLSNGVGLRDSCLLVIKKRVGNIVSLVDSPTSKTTAILRRAAATLNSAFLIGSGATDTMFCEDLFGVLTVADSCHDTAGVTMTYPIYTEAYFKK